MDIPKDLGQRIVEATRLAVMLHLQRELLSQHELRFPSGGTGRNSGRAALPIGGADFLGGAAMDGGDFTPLPASSNGAGTLAAGGASAAESEVA